MVKKIHKVKNRSRKERRGVACIDKVLSFELEKALSASRPSGET
jgi:hypothetical protein